MKQFLLRVNTTAEYLKGASDLTKCFCSHYLFLSAILGGSGLFHDVQIRNPILGMVELSKGNESQE